MRLKVTQIGSGAHPSQVMVSIDAEDGVRHLVLNRMSIEGNTIEIGYPVGRRGDHFLVELPEETDSGELRVWVDKALTVDDGMREAAE
jgi:hypothetical protein